MAGMFIKMIRSAALLYILLGFLMFLIRYCPYPIYVSRFSFTYNGLKIWPYSCPSTPSNSSWFLWITSPGSYYWFGLH